MSKYLILACLCLFSFIGFGGNSKGYDLKIRIKDLANKKVILGHRFTDKLYPNDTLKLDNSGFGALKGDTKFPEGIYFLLTPSKKMVDFFLTDNQHFTIQADTLDLYENLKFENSPENTEAIEYRRYITHRQQELARLKETKRDISGEEKQAYENLKKKTTELIENQKDNFVGSFFNALQEITIPDPPKDAKGNVIDSLFKAKYYRTHFFDNMDLKDARFLRTTIYDEKIKTYLNRVVPQIPDTINMECDKLLNITKNDPELFRYMLVTLFNYAAGNQIMGFDAVYVHVAEKWYLPNATFEDSAFVRKTRINIEKLKPVLIGQTAPELKMLWVPSVHFTEAETDTLARKNPYIGSFIKLSEINSKYTILAFWESDCSHCKKMIPELYDVYKKLKDRGVTVMSVHMLGGIDGKKQWVEFVNKHALYDWMNVWNPYDFSYKKVYDITITPTIFVLDKDKKIIAKKIDPGQIEGFLNLYEKFNSRLSIQSQSKK
jgi:thiol-disulfide isomerase/thioredoxin